MNSNLFSTALPMAVSNPKDVIDGSYGEPLKKQNKNAKEKSEKERVEKALVKNQNPHPDLLINDRTIGSGHLLANTLKTAQKGFVSVGSLLATVSSLVDTKNPILPEKRSKGSK